MSRAGLPRSARPLARHVADEAVVRRYLRSVVGAPVRGRSDPDDEAEFIGVVRRWAERAGVDRATLVDVGVDPSVLNRAELAMVPANQRLRRYWQPGSFSVADLVRRSGKPIATVRRAVAMDEEAGLLRRVARHGRTILYKEN